MNQLFSKLDLDVLFFIQKNIKFALYEAVFKGVVII